MPIRALIFDVGGVFLQLPDHIRQQQWEAHFNLPEGAIRNALLGTDLSTQATVGKISAEEVWTFLAQRLGLSHDQLLHIRRRYGDDEQLDPHMHALVQRLRPHYTLALLTNAWSDARFILSERFALSRLVDEMIISAEVGLAKPDAAIYQYAIARLGMQASEAVFVDNKLRNIRAAQMLGMHSIHFLSSAQAIAEIERVLATG